MTPRWVKHYYIPFLPATPSSPSWTLEGLFELTRRPSRAHDLPRALLQRTTEIQGHCQVCRARCKGPRTLSRTIDENLDCVFVENALVFLVPNIGRAWASQLPLNDAPVSSYLTFGRYCSIESN